MKLVWPFLLILFIAVLVVANASLFIVNQTEQALVLEFGQIRRVESTPGLKWKIPFVETVSYFDRRLLDFTAPPTEMITEDKGLGIRERIVIDAYVKYRISDPVQFYKAVSNEQGLEGRLGRILLASIRSTVGDVSLRELLSDKRTTIMQAVRDEVNRKAADEPIETGADQAKKIAAGVPVAATPADVPENGIVTSGRGFGIEVVDVRIMRADLPGEISQSTYKRMQASFNMTGQKFRSEGDEESMKVRSSAERERTELIAGAKKNAEIIRGEGDGEANRIYAAAFGQDPGFFDFYRSMQAYRQTFTQTDTSAVLSPDNAFLHYLEKE